MTAPETKAPPTRVRLTKSAIAAAAVRPAPYFLTDTGVGAIPGFAIRVLPSGRKSFVLRYRLGGRASAPTLVTIGEWPTLTVEQARSEATRLRVEVLAAKDDPSRNIQSRRKAAREVRKAEKEAPTLADLFDKYLEDKKREGLSADHLANLTYRIGVSVHKIGPQKGQPVQGHLRQHMGTLKAKDVTRADVKAYHDARRAEHPDDARRAVKLLRSVYSWAKVEGLVPAGCDPTAAVKLAKPAPSKRAALTSDEYAALGATLARAETVGIPTAPARAGRSRGMSRARREKATGRKRGPYKRATSAPTERTLNPVALACLRFIAMTGWRKTEARTLTWSALDAERREATLAQTKTGVSVRPLGDVVWKWLESLRACAWHVPNSPHVFPRLDDPRHPLRELGGVWENVKHAAALPEAFTPHSLRHAFTTVCRELGYSEYVIAALVGHSQGSTQTGRYGTTPTSVVAKAASEVSATIVARMDRKDGP